MADFLPALRVLLLHEGGFVDDPNDHGGVTNFGISVKVIVPHFGLTADDLGIPDLSSASIRSMSLDSAIEVYRKHYWLAEGYGQLVDQDVATKVFDSAVNFTPRAQVRFNRGHLLLQKALCDLGAEIELDGIFGGQTLQAANKTDPQLLLREFCATLSDWYRAIVKADPTQARFLAGWLKRASWSRP